ncbi:Protein CUP-SHAPED COTYLEDON 2 [Hibiscus syriacus]|uniref:Protein CUP-SHAPED COTYLEDON 2 n=1 Tax=Hibiscus syriacus TaxID=106335 RepID=A0A6A2ZL37_HIBSY|nr:protein CUP-SHAPED COTYLEDON 3-like [Hibiscus syriacus]KAE8692187.1 Protein CUP-SHAPED COTYLEDON 2 [Hibiscus syriacus]
MGLRDIGATLPPGFRFYPSDEELVCHYLYKKIVNEHVLKGTLVDIDLHTCEPWQLPEVAKLNANEWYFFSFRDRKYATGFRTNRATTSGYWKATGKDRVVVDPRTETVVGMRKTLVFHGNRAPNGIKTGWIMHEFRLHTPHMPPKEEWVLCRVFHKSKEENSTKLSSPMMLETSNDTPSLTHRTTYQQISSSTTPTYQSHAQCLLNLLQYNSHQENNSNEVTSKVYDGYDDLLWNMEENSSLGGHHLPQVASNVGNTRFGTDKKYGFS